VMELFDALHDEGFTIVVITHNQAIAGRANRAITIHDGELTDA
jgi:putative ABC transport system ATP-binding protein